jgi:hypothetical protein
MYLIWGTSREQIDNSPVFHGPHAPFLFLIDARVHLTRTAVSAIYAVTKAFSNLAAEWKCPRSSEAGRVLSTSNEAREEPACRAIRGIRDRQPREFKPGGFLGLSPRPQ